MAAGIPSPEALPPQPLANIRGVVVSTLGLAHQNNPDVLGYWEKLVQLVQQENPGFGVFVNDILSAPLPQTPPTPEATPTPMQVQEEGINFIYNEVDGNIREETTVFIENGKRTRKQIYYYESGNGLRLYLPDEIIVKYKNKELPFKFDSDSGFYRHSTKEGSTYEVKFGVVYANGNPMLLFYPDVIKDTLSGLTYSTTGVDSDDTASNKTDNFEFQQGDTTSEGLQIIWQQIPQGIGGPADESKLLTEQENLGEQDYLFLPLEITSQTVRGIYQRYGEGKIIQEELKFEVIDKNGGDLIDGIIKTLRDNFGRDSNLILERKDKKGTGFLEEQQFSLRLKLPNEMGYLEIGELTLGSINQIPNRISIEGFSIPIVNRNIREFDFNQRDRQDNPKIARPADSDKIEAWIVKLLDNNGNELKVNLVLNGKEYPAKPVLYSAENGEFKLGQFAIDDSVPLQKREISEYEAESITSFHLETVLNKYVEEYLPEKRQQGMEFSVFTEELETYKLAKGMIRWETLKLIFSDGKEFTTRVLKVSTQHGTLNVLFPEPEEFLQNTMYLTEDEKRELERLKLSFREGDNEISEKLLNAVEKYLKFILYVDTYKEILRESIGDKTNPDEVTSLVLELVFNGKIDIKTGEYILPPLDEWDPLKEGVNKSLYIYGGSIPLNEVFSLKEEQQYLAGYYLREPLFQGEIGDHNRNFVVSARFLDGDNSQSFLFNLYIPLKNSYYGSLVSVTEGGREPVNDGSLKKKYAEVMEIFGYLMPLYRATGLAYEGIFRVTLNDVLDYFVDLSINANFNTSPIFDFGVPPESLSPFHRNSERLWKDLGFTSLGDYDVNIFSELPNFGNITREGVDEFFQLIIENQQQFKGNTPLEQPQSLEEVLGRIVSIKNAVDAIIQEEMHVTLGFNAFVSKVAERTNLRKENLTEEEIFLLWKIYSTLRSPIPFLSGQMYSSN